MKNNVWKCCIAAVVSTAMCSLCTRVDKSLGDNIVPPDQRQPIAIDTLENYFVLRSTPLDSITTAAFSEAAIGIYDDPRFGKTIAGFAAQFEPQTYENTTYFNGIDVSTIVFDSLTLVIQFSGTFFGTNTDNPDAAADMNIDVYELTKVLNDSTTYYGAFTSGTTNPIDGYIDRDKNMSSTKISPWDTIISITLTSTELLSRLQSAAQAASMTQEEFLANYFKGLYITASGTANGCIKYVSPVITSTTTTVTTAMWAYYHYTNADTLVHALYPYLLYSSAPRLNVFEHERKLLSEDSLALQGLYGSGIEVKFSADSVRKWRSKTINRVELLLDIDEGERTNAARLNMFPSSLSVLYKKDSTYSVIRDVTVGTVDGAISRSAMRYTLNITHFFADVVKGTADAMYVVPSTFYSAMTYGVVKNKPLLRITYGEPMIQ